MKKHLVKTVVTCTAVAISAVCSYAQMDVRTFQQLRLERTDAPGTYVNLEVPSSAITAYTLIWPATPPPVGGFLIVENNSNPFQLKWAIPTGNLLETTGNRDLRRSATASEGGITGSVGYQANDFQGSRNNSNEAASANQSIIMGGQQNDINSGGYQGSIGGGFSNELNDQAVILGGNNNTVTSSGYLGTILGGQNNSNGGSSRASMLAGTGNATSGNLSIIMGGQGNTATANNSATVGGLSNASTGNFSMIFGGYSNSSTQNHSLIMGGSNNSVTGDQNGIVAGQSNSASNNQSFIGAGQSNTVNSSNPNAILAGTLNDATAGYTFVATGNNNNATVNRSAILYGAGNNTTSGEHTIIAGGVNNTISGGNYSAIISGFANTSTQQYGYIMGGRSGTVSEQNTLLFNAGPGTITHNVASQVIWNNVNIMMANNSGAANGVRLYENNSTSTLPDAAANYVRIIAPDSITSGVDNTYTWPSVSSFSVGRVIDIASSPTPDATTATLRVTSNPNTYSSRTSTANNAFPTLNNLPTTTQVGEEFLRINPNGTPVNRVVTLKDGSSNGFILTIIVYNATATNGIRLVDGNGLSNLQLNGDADLTQNDSITLVWDDTSDIWFELGRRDN